MDKKQQSSDTALQFFAELYGDNVGQGGQIVMWSRVRGVDVAWKADSKSAAALAAERGLRIDSYFQPCLHRGDLCMAEVDRRIAMGEKVSRKLTHHRGYHESATVMPGVWADIDTQDGEHKDPMGLPESTEAVVKMLKQTAVAPTYVIDTGGGVHAYWLFDEPWILETDEERTEAYELSYKWLNGYVRGEMQDRNWPTLDAVHDLTRVMRVPGTLNCKYDPPRPVKIVLSNPRKRYSPDAIEMHIPVHMPVGTPPKRMGIVQGLDRLIIPETESAVVSAMRSMDQNFNSIWTGDRGYKSQSERDLAIATVMFGNGVKTEDVMGAMTLNRILRGGRSPKDKGLRYYETTIAKAKSNSVDPVETGRELEEIREVLSEKRVAIESGGQSANDARAELLASVGQLLGLREGLSIVAIECVTQGGATARTYNLVTSSGTVCLGGIEGITSEMKFGNSLTDVFRSQPKRLGSKRWPSVVEILLQLIDDVDLGEDATQDGQTASILKRWIANATPASGLRETNLHRAMSQGLPWFNNGRVYVSPSMSFDQIKRLGDSKLTQHMFTRRLKELDAKLVKKSAKLPNRDGGKRVTYDLWLLPYEEPFWV